MARAEATPTGVRVTSLGWISTGRDRGKRVLGIVPIQEAPVAQHPLAVLPDGLRPSPHVAADHADVQVRQASGKLLRLLNQL